MRNESQAFAYQPEGNEPIVAPVEVAENKYMITRYFRDKSDTEKDIRYFVFEKK